MPLLLLDVFYCSCWSDPVPDSDARKVEEKTWRSYSVSSLIYHITLTGVLTSLKHLLPGWIRQIGLSRAASK